jgi:hypothetical protein
MWVEEKVGGKKSGRGQRETAVLCRLLEMNVNKDADANFFIGMRFGNGAEEFALFRASIVGGSAPLVLSEGAANGEGGVREVRVNAQALFVDDTADLVAVLPVLHAQPTCHVAHRRAEIPKDASHVVLDRYDGPRAVEREVLPAVVVVAALRTKAK